MSLALSFFLSEFGKINNIETILTPHGTHPYTSDDTINNLWLHSSKFLLSKNFDCIAVQSPIMLNFLTFWLPRPPWGGTAVCISVS